MQLQSAATLPGKPNKSDRQPHDYLTYRQIQEQYPGTVQAVTLSVWASVHRYDFHLIVTKIGSNSRVRRDRWERFLDERTIGQGSLGDPGGAERSDR